MVKWFRILLSNHKYMTNYLKMTHNELNINTVMYKLTKKELTIKEASKLINKSERHTKRIKKKYVMEWSKWLIHKARWKTSNNKWNDSKYKEAVQIIKDKYHDYGPTLSAEKLLEKHKIIIPVSTMRLQMIKNWIWKHKKRKKDDKQFTARPRKEAYWEMIQHDWSYHMWFEWRNWTWHQCLLVSVDDATWKVDAKFTKNEWLVETFKYFKEYIIVNWKPKSIYVDKYATYKINYPEATDNKDLKTQFGRVCDSLWIDLIFANSPQAKWRVERMNWTFQDRLIKSLREENISDMETANKFLKDVFLPDFNRKFEREPKSNSDLHLTLRDDEIKRIDQIFSEHKERVIANDFTIRFENKYYQLFRKKDWWYTIRKSNTITVEKHLNWDIKISKNWIYIDTKISFERPERWFKLLTAPISESNLEQLKLDITEKEKREQMKKIEEKVDIKTDTYYEKDWKSLTFVANVR